MSSQNIFSVNQIADYFLSKVSTDKGDSISPLKLQKLVYYAQAWNCTIFDSPLFEEKIEAWVHGPVVPSLYARFADVCRNCVIDIPNTALDIIKFPENIDQLLSEVQCEYGEHSASYLEALTHSETPWIEARGSLKPYERSNGEITKESMKSFYGEMLVSDGK